MSVMDPGFPVCVCVCVCVWGGGGGGGQMTHAHVLLQLGYGGLAVSSSIGSREEHITLYVLQHQPIFQQVKECMEALVPTVHVHR